ncbi:hypothetical protein F4779DRAFT_614091 [Xylariaceae sp. FL0662B]|nr:hypothetical protein F4779DRAFT_614091 [Xylariaceae sp. FL0662B]
MALHVEPDDTEIAFEDFDLKEVFEKAEPHVANRNSRNFVVEFGPARAHIAFNLNASQFEQLLNEDGNRDYPIRWINIWDPRIQEGVMKPIARRYDFSKRLAGLMTLSISPPQVDQDHPRKSKNFLDRHHGSPKDLEKGGHVNGDVSPTTTAKKEAPKIASFEDDNLQLYLQLKDTVNYFSTDQTRRALCIGAHWLHNRPHREHEDRRTGSIMPPKHWQWLVLCNDCTVLSIHEAPVFESAPEKESEQAWQAEELRHIRANTLDVLLQLSKCGYDLFRNNPLSQSSIRETLSSEAGEATDRPELSRNQTGMSYASNGEPANLANEGTSNLFYYLFEDYVAAGPLKIAERRLKGMTHKILRNTHRNVSDKSSEIIPTLHHLSKDLRELKHLFENYKNLINKIMAVGKVDLPSNGLADQGHNKVALTASALSRFDRLGDRLQYLMLNTIEGHLEEIAALSTTYFNLTQQKDSNATARLTRSATLLAKLSVFFLPISFMTSYFSIQIEDLYRYWNGRTYWYAFAGIASGSFVCLFFFSRLLMLFSDVMDDWAAHIAKLCRILGRALGFKLKDDDDEDD